MKIIKEGKRPEPEPEIEATCEACGTVFSFDKISEANLVQSSMTEENGSRIILRLTSYWEVACPICTRVVSVKA